MTLQCRFYANRFPEVDDVVMVNVRSVAEMGVYVTLLEYDNIEAMIPLSELSRRRIRSINKLIRVNSNEAVVVIRVDENKGYIDLSKRRVSHEEVLKCEENFAKGKAVNSILRHVGELLQYKTGKELDELYQKTAWMFDEKYKKQGAAYEAFKHSVTNPEILDECDIDDNTRITLITNIKRRLSPQSVKLRADIELVCTNYEGIDAIKRALRKGLEVSTEDLPIKINLISPPLFVITIQTLAQVEGLVALNEAIVAIKSSIEDEGGLFNLKLQPKIMCDQDEDSLMKQLQGVGEDGGVSDGDDDKDSDSSNSDDPDGSI